MLINLTPNTVAQYKMNDAESSDIVINEFGADGTYVTDDTINVTIPGKINTALNFDGTNYIETGLSFASTFQDSFSINLWGNLTGNHPLGNSIYGQWETGVGALRLVYTPTLLYFEYRINSAPGQIILSYNPGYQIFGTSVYPIDVWQMITITVEKISSSRAIARMYVNGVEVNDSGEKNVDMSSWNNSKTLRIASDQFYGIKGIGGYDNFGIFDKILTEDEIGFLHNHGRGTEELIGNFGIDEFSSPTITYPVGGEKLIHEVIQITWEESFWVARGGAPLLYWYEIFYSIDAESEENRLWNKIADVPSGNSTFDWKIPRGIRSDRCRIGIRMVDNEGTRTPMIMSSNVFSIQNKILPSPAVASPLDGDRFFTYIPVIFDQSGLAGQFPKRAHYRVSYTSDSKNSDWTCIGDNISIETAEAFLDVSSLPSASDYSLKFELIDGENSSSPTLIKDITINNLNFFKIDTVPPVGLISVRNNAEYISERDIILEITAYDATTGTESFRVIQKEIDSGEDDTVGPLFPMSDMSSWRVVNSDGIKLIQSSFVDFAGNTVEPVSSEFFFRTYKSVDNREVTSLLVNKNDTGYDVWQAIGGVAPEIYLNGLSIVGAEATGTSSYLPTDISGGGLNYEQIYNIEGLGSIDVDFEAYSVEDRLVIEGGGSVLHDTGLMSGSISFNLSVVGLNEITVKITSDSAGTGWIYKIRSKDEYPLTSDFYDTAASQDKPQGEVLSMAIYNDVLYLGEEQKDATGLLQRYTGGHIESVYEISSLDSAINSMVGFDTNLFLACQNGELYSFNGTTVQLENTFESTLNKIGTDGNLLYIFLENSEDIYTAYKDIYGDLNYVKTTLE